MCTIVAPAARTASVHLAVALRAAGLDDRADARVEGELRPVGEREERVGGEHRALQLVTELPRLVEREPDGVDAAHLPGADPDRLAPPREHDRVRVDVLDDRPGEEELLPEAGVGVAADDVHRVERVAVGVTVLDEQPAEHAPQVALGRDERAPLVVGQHARRLAAGEVRERLVGEPGRVQHLDELLGERASRARR